MEEDLTIRTLTVTAYEENEGKSLEVTLAPGKIQMIAASDDIRQGRTLKHVRIVFDDGGMAEVWVTEVDLITMQQCVGLYAMPY